MKKSARRSQKKNTKLEKEIIKSAKGARLTRGMSATNAVRAAKMHYSPSNITAGVTAQFGSYELQFDQLSGYADFAAVFDCYRIRKAKFQFFPHANVHNLTEVNTAAVAACRPILTAVDYDDSNTPSSIDELEQFNSVQVHDPYKPFALTFKPKPAGGVYAGGVTLGYSQLNDDTWIDCANDDVVHYGLKWGTYANGASQTVFQSWKVFVTAWVEFRQPR